MKSHRKSSFTLCLGIFFSLVCFHAISEDKTQAPAPSTSLIGTTSIVVSYPNSEVDNDATGTNDAAARTSQGAASTLSAIVTFDKDVRVNGNGLPGGTYEIDLHHIAKNDTQIVFSQRIINEDSGRNEKKERLRLAARPAKAPKVKQFMVDIEPIIVEPPKEGERRRRRRPKPPSATMNFRWDTRLATLNLEMTGLLWRSTPPPEGRDRIRAPWALVLSSLNGFVEESMDKHVEHFADNFESDWDDGGSEEAHVQFIGRMMYSGEFEGTVLKLDKLEWKEEPGGSIHFTEVGVQGPFGSAALMYRVAMTDQGWKIIHLDGPKDE